MSKDYYIGLDLGTSSIGWAVTDSNYNILRKKGKDLWGIREFDEATTAEARRSNRTSRRRRLREVARIEILNSFFEKEIEKVDKNFLKRLKESKYYLEDKEIDCKYSIFADKNYTDNEYFKEYPTIFHLRKSLIEKDEKFDVRLVYLAILNMFKHRGHFLSNISSDIKGYSINELYLELINKSDFIKDEKSFIYIEGTSKLYPDKNISKLKAVENIANILEIDKKKDKKHYEILKAIYGINFDLKVIWNKEEFNEEKYVLNFRDLNEDNFSKIQDNITDDKNEFIELLRNIHDNIYLSSIMKSHKYLCYAKVENYEKHKKDLKLLKDFIKSNKPEIYNSIFREENVNSYSKYIGSINYNNLKVRRIKEKDSNKFFKELEKIIKDFKDCDEKEYILNEIKNETFLPKQITTANGVIPNQLYVSEMKAILKNAEKYLTFLNDKDETGLSVSEKILQLFSFHIPYYVGPLIHTKDNNGWVVRKEEKGKIYPWNFEQKIDIKQSADKFIENLIKDCTYISGEKVLPKNSLMYEKFMVLNELNNLKIDNNKIPVELKQDIYNDLFLQGKKVKRKQIENYLIGKGVLKDNEGDRISGINNEFNSYLSSYQKFSKVFENMKDSNIKDIIEEIIYYGTVYGDDKKFYSETIKEKYGQILSNEQIKIINGFKFKDWGNLSKEFLNLLGCNKSDGEILSFIDMMWETNNNHMELLSNKYTYIDEIKNKKDEIIKTLTTFNYDDIKDMYFSAPVKRMIWQSILILKEIVSVMGYEPKRVFIEMPRSEEKNKNIKSSRKKQIEDIYKQIKNDSDIKELSETLKGKNEADFRNRRLYLYYMQKGRCMYSGEAINISDIFNENLYDIDHIYPRHFVKDDSIHNNLVLVKKQINSDKQDIYPIDNSIYQKQKDFWKMLRKQNLITEEKYIRLTNRNPFTEEQLAGFINRQIVETGQATKSVAHILEDILPKSKIVYVKSGIVSDFRHKFKFYKSREVNDFHHSQDAYLNIVLGNVYYVKFTDNTLNFIKGYIKNPKDNKYHMNRILDYDIERKGEIAWNASKEKGTIKTIEKYLYKASPILTRMPIEEKGQLFEATMYKKEIAKENSYFPLKTSDKRLLDIKKYGGYKSIKGTYYFLVEHEVKDKKVRTIENMPLYLGNKIGGNIDLMKEYCINNLGFKNPDIRIKKIKMQSLIKFNGYYGYLGGRSNNSISIRNAVSMCFNRDETNYIKKLENFKTKGYIEDVITKEKNEEFYKKLLDKHKNNIFKNRPNNMYSKLESKFDLFKSLDINEQCQVLCEILKLTRIGDAKADLTTIKEVKNSGVMTLNKNISKLDECILIYQSPTGLFEKRVDLLKV